MPFNPLANSFNTTFFVMPEGTGRFGIMDVKLRKQKWGEGEAYLLDFATRVEQGNADTNGKLVTISTAIASYDPATQNARADAEGNIVVDFKQPAEIVHACFGYENGRAEEDERFAREHANLDLSIDFPTLTLGSGWTDLKGCSFVADVTHRQDKKDPNKIYPKFNKIRAVNR